MSFSSGITRPAGRIHFFNSDAISPREEVVEEICQEVFLTVIKSLASFQAGHCQFQTWLFRLGAQPGRVNYRQRPNYAAKRGGGQITVSAAPD